MALRAAGGGGGGTSGGGGESLEAVVLGAGPTAITHDDHSNRAVSSDETLPTSIVFAATATSGAVDGDLVTISNMPGAGHMTASGAIRTSPGCKLWVRAGETFIAEYNAAEDKYYSKTPDIRKGGQTWSFSSRPISGQTTVSANGIVAHTMLDSSTIQAASTATTSRVTHIQRCTINSNATTDGKIAGIRVDAGPLRGLSATVPFDFKIRLIGGINDAYTAGSFAMGIGPSASGIGEPSAGSNIILLGGDSTDANLQIMHNDAGTAVEIPLGASFPNHTDGVDLYELVLDFVSDGVARRCFYIVRNLKDGAEAEGVITTDLPVDGTALGPFCWRNNTGESGSTVSVRWGGWFAGDAA